MKTDCFVWLHFLLEKFVSIHIYWFGDEAIFQLCNFIISIQWLDSIHEGIFSSWWNKSLGWDTVCLLRVDLIILPTCVVISTSKNLKQSRKILCYSSIFQFVHHNGHFLVIWPLLQASFVWFWNYSLSRSKR